MKPVKQTDRHVHQLSLTGESVTRRGARRSSSHTDTLNGLIFVFVTAGGTISSFAATAQDRSLQPRASTQASASEGKLSIAAAARATPLSETIPSSAPAAILTVVVGKTSVDGNMVRPPVLLSQGQELAVAEEARAVVFFPATGLEFEVRNGSVRIAAQGILPIGGKQLQVSRKERPGAFKTARLNSSALVQAGAQFKSATGTQVSPNRQVVLPQPITFSWPIADREGPFALHILAMDGRRVFRREVDSLAYVLDEPAMLEAGKFFQWEVTWTTTAGNARAVGGEFRTADAALVNVAENLRALVAQDADGLALFAAWAASQIVAY